MNPRLIIISGSLKGETFELGSDQFSIGREAANSVCLSEPSVSRRHSLIETDGGEFKIVDLDSYNGTFVNGVPVKRQTLAHGDQITIGGFTLLFLLEGEAPTPEQLVHLDPNLVTQSTRRLSREDATHLSSDRASSESPPSARVARDLGALLQISTSVRSIRDIETLQRELLDSIFEVVPAERGAILLSNNEKEITSAYGRVKGSEDHRVSVSSTVVKQVMSEGVSLLSNCVADSEALAAAESLITARTASVICVPLSVFEKIFGAIYLDTSDPAERFDDGHLQLLTGIAGIAAVAIENARHVERLEHENQRLQQVIQVEHKMIGESESMQQVYAFIAKVAPTDSTVLISGESGTGKELAAHAIHLNSPRAAKPFVAINCATLSETLLESELFGHEKGAFTGAIGQKRGKLEIADGGTVFLDEVGELTPPIQGKLLRVLQEREFDRVGGTRPVKIDVRIITATNRDLEQSIKAKTFRQDLYYRLNVVSVEMPPLKDRRDDIPLLASYFASVYSKKCKRRVEGISPEARSLLRAYDWPGNVRELENAIERAVVLGATELIMPEDLPETLCEVGDESGDFPITRYHEAVKESKRRLIVKAIEEAKGNYTEAARLLGVHPNNLHRLIRNLNLKAAIGK